MLQSSFQFSSVSHFVFSVARHADKILHGTRRDTVPDSPTYIAASLMRAAQQQDTEGVLFAFKKLRHMSDQECCDAYAHIRQSPRTKDFMRVVTQILEAANREALLNLLNEKRTAIRAAAHSECKHQEKEQNAIKQEQQLQTARNRYNMVLARHLEQYVENLLLLFNAAVDDNTRMLVASVLASVGGNVRTMASPAVQKVLSQRKNNHLDDDTIAYLLKDGFDAATAAQTLIALGAPINILSSAAQNVLKEKKQYRNNTDEQKKHALQHMAMVGIYAGITPEEFMDAISDAQTLTPQQQKLLRHAMTFIKDNEAYNGQHVAQALLLNIGTAQSAATQQEIGALPPQAWEAFSARLLKELEEHDIGRMMQSEDVPAYFKLLIGFSISDPDILAQCRFDASSLNDLNDIVQFMHQLLQEKMMFQHLSCTERLNKHEQLLELAEKSGFARQELRDALYAQPNFSANLMTCIPLGLNTITDIASSFIMFDEIIETPTIQLEKYGFIDGGAVLHGD